MMPFILKSQQRPHIRKHASNNQRTSLTSPRNQQCPGKFTNTHAVDTSITAPFDLHVGLQQIERKIASGYAKSTREMHCVSLNASFLPVLAEQCHSCAYAAGTATYGLGFHFSEASYLGRPAPRNADLLLNTQLLQGTSK